MLVDRQSSAATHAPSRLRAAWCAYPRRSAGMPLADDRRRAQSVIDIRNILQ